MPWKKPGHHVSTKISQDFRTGETVTKDVLKQDLFPAKCTFTVELFDAKTGELVQKEVSENRLSAYIINCLFRQTFIENFMYYYNDSNTNLTDLNNRLGQIFSPQSNNRSIFSTILLTKNSKILEDPYDRFVWGFPVGMSSLSEARPGTSSFAGMLNTGETNIKKENGKITKHFVVDFATNQGNGTFQSIYITGAGRGANMIEPYDPVLNTCIKVPGYRDASWDDPKQKTIPCPNFYVQSSSYTTRLIFTEDIIYMYFHYINNSSSSRGAIIDKKLYPIDRATKTILTPLIVPDNMIYIVYDGTYFWGMDKSKKIYKMDGKMTVLSTITLPGQFPGKILNNDYVSIVHIAVDSKYLYIAYTGRTTDTSTDHKGAFALLTITKTGVFVHLSYFYEKMDQSDSSSYSDGAIMMLPNNRMAIVQSSVPTIYVEKESMGDQWYSWPSLISRGCYDPYADAFYSDSHYRDFGIVEEHSDRRYQYYMLAYELSPATSHTLLPSPVTKTSANTMKIQYDLVVDDIGYFDKL